jgi:hypothetical protein
MTVPERQYACPKPVATKLRQLAQGLAYSTNTLLPPLLPTAMICFDQPAAIGLFAFSMASESGWVKVELKPDGEYRQAA